MKNTSIYVVRIYSTFLRKSTYVMARNTYFSHNIYNHLSSVHRDNVSPVYTTKFTLATRTSSYGKTMITIQYLTTSTKL